MGFYERQAARRKEAVAKHKAKYPRQYARAKEIAKKEAKKSKDVPFQTGGTVTPTPKKTITPSTDKDVFGRERTMLEKIAIEKHRREGMSIKPEREGAFRRVVHKEVSREPSVYGKEKVKETTRILEYKKEPLEILGKEIPFLYKPATYYETTKVTEPVILAYDQLKYDTGEPIFTPEATARDVIYAIELGKHPPVGEVTRETVIGGSLASPSGSDPFVGRKLERGAPSVFGKEAMAKSEARVYEAEGLGKARAGLSYGARKIIRERPFSLGVAGVVATGAGAVIPPVVALIPVGLTAGLPVVELGFAGYFAYDIGKTGARIYKQPTAEARYISTGMAGVELGVTITGAAIGYKITQPLTKLIRLSPQRVGVELIKGTGKIDIKGYELPKKYITETFEVVAKKSTRYMYPEQYATHLAKIGKITYKPYANIRGTTIGDFSPAFHSISGKSKIRINSQLTKRSSFRQKVLSHELIHYEFSKKTPEFIYNIESKLPYKLRPSEMLAYTFESSKSRFKVVFPETKVKFTATKSLKGAIFSEAQVDMTGIRYRNIYRETPIAKITRAIQKKVFKTDFPKESVLEGGGVLQLITKGKKGVVSGDFGYELITKYKPSRFKKGRIEIDAFRSELLPTGIKVTQRKIIGVAEKRPFGVEIDFLGKKAFVGLTGESYKVVRTGAGVRGEPLVYITERLGKITKVKGKPSIFEESITRKVTRTPFPEIEMTASYQLKTGFERGKQKLFKDYESKVTEFGRYGTDIPTQTQYTFGGKLSRKADLANLKLIKEYRDSGITYAFEKSKTDIFGKRSGKFKGDILISEKYADLYKSPSIDKIFEKIITKEITPKQAYAKGVSGKLVLKELMMQQQFKGGAFAGSAYLAVPKGMSIPASDFIKAPVALHIDKTSMDLRESLTLISKNQLKQFERRRQVIETKRELMPMEKQMEGTLTLQVPKMAQKERAGVISMLDTRLIEKVAQKQRTEEILKGFPPFVPTPRTGFSFDFFPYTPSIVVPPFFGIPDFKFPKGLPRESVKTKRKFKYTPSLVATELGIFGEEPTGELTIQLRPISKGYKKFLKGFTGAKLI